MFYPKIPYPAAEQITSRYQLSEDAQALLTEGISPEQFIAILNKKALYQDVVVFIAHGLPPRECIAWALQCCQDIEPINDKEHAALSAARAWYLRPDESNRRMAEKAAQIAELQTAPGWVAQAVFWSAGSITPPDTPLVSPPPWLYCHAIAGAINLAAILPDGTMADKRYPLFIQRGIAIAQGNMPQRP